MSKESACRNSKVSSGLRISSIPFSEIPGQTQLFLDYQRDPSSLSAFYPTAVSSVSELPDRAAGVIASYQTDRNVLADALHEINSFAGPEHPTFRGIERLRQSNTVAVLTGQQAGLFSGPLYTIYKALSAIALAKQLDGQGIPAVPVFWAATEDHDFAEISSASVVGDSSSVVPVKYASTPPQQGSPVGRITLDPHIDSAVADLIETLPQTEFTDEVAHEIASLWKQGSTFGESFIAHLARLLGRHGLVFADPLHAKLKQLAAPIYQAAVNSSDELVSRLIARGRELSSHGYHSQVLVEPDYFPLFWHTETGERSAIRKDGEWFVSKADRRQFSRDELAEIARDTPDRLSPGVMLRSVVQDYLFPTLCYFGGGAEIAYFAQNSVVYQTLGRPVTPILHRQSFTVVDARAARNLEALGMEFCDVFASFDAMSERVVEQTISPETAELFAAVEERINTELNRLDRHLSDTDPTLAKNLATRRRKIVYHIAALRKKAYMSELRRHETADARLRSIYNSLYPANGLQERTINVTTFLNRYGPNFIDWVLSAGDLDDRGHRVIYL